MEIKPVGGRCPPAPPAPAIGEWGPYPNHLSWSLKTLDVKTNMRVTPSPSPPPGMVTF